MRLQVYLSHNGVCSRRKALSLIQQGHVVVNGRLVKEPSFAIDARADKVSVDGNPVKSVRYDYIILNKPPGYTTTKSDPHARQTVYELLPRQYHHLAPVGRLDQATEGLLFLTNDGEINYQLTHPRFQTEKKYFVGINSPLQINHKTKLEAGVYLDGKKTAPAKINISRKKKDYTSLYITIHEGRYRQIRRMFAKVKYKVVYLQRIQHGPIKLGTLKLGHWRHLTKHEKQLLLNLCHPAASDL